VATVLVEVKGPTTTTADLAARLGRIKGVIVDLSYEPVPMGNGANATHIVRATVDDNAEASLRADPSVVGVWRDTPIAPFQS
jgi:hypothetical protein